MTPDWGSMNRLGIGNRLETKIKRMVVNYYKLPVNKKKMLYVSKG